ncbi:MAG: succinate dehydrogenase assembly factor 2 [Pseudomonadota bacterium]|nr:MAG: succinate dehydrogenase assembly factor 2 [Pseudomonadota bacterium]
MTPDGLESTHDLARLRWRCRRGLLELDLYLRRFVDQHYASLDSAERAAFERLLDTPDLTLLAFLQEREQPDAELQALVAKIRQ